jgi:hypothetical protein
LGKHGKKSKKRDHRRDKITQRDLSNITKSSDLLRKKYEHYIISINKRRDLRRLPSPSTDLRRWRPHRDDLLMTDGRPARLVLKRPRSNNLNRDPTQDRLSFKNPRNVDICRRRRARRISLFATGNVGKGVKKKRRITDNSKIRC